VGDKNENFIFYTILGGRGIVTFVNCFGIVNRNPLKPVGQIKFYSIITESRKSLKNLDFVSIFQLPRFCYDTY
jgi:hypothetical protein